MSTVEILVDETEVIEVVEQGPQGVPAEGTGGLVWGGEWTAGTYLANTQVSDAGGLYISNVLTNERPSPQSIEEFAFEAPDVVPWTTKTNSKQVFCGTGGVVPEGEIYKIRAYRFWVNNNSAGYKYSVWIKKFNDSSEPVFVKVLELLGETLELGWNKYSLEEAYLYSGDNFEIVLQIQNTDSSLIVEGDWIKEDDSNGDIASLSSWNVNKNNTKLKINSTDLGSINRQAELLNIISGSEITLTDETEANRFVVYQVLDNPTIDVDTLVFPVTLVNQGSWGVPVSGSTNSLLADIPIEAVTEYSESSYTWAEGEGLYGLLSLSGSVNDLVTNDNLYIDLELQEVIKSNDWATIIEGEASTSQLEVLEETPTIAKEDILRVAWKATGGLPEYQVADVDNVPLPIHYSHIASNSAMFEVNLEEGTFTALEYCDVFHLTINAQIVRGQGGGTDQWGIFLETMIGGQWYEVPESTRYFTFKATSDDELKHMSYTVYSKEILKGSVYRISQITSDVSDKIGLVTSKPFTNAPVSAGIIVSLSTRTESK